MRYKLLFFLILFISIINNSFSQEKKTIYLIEDSKLISVNADYGFEYNNDKSIENYGLRIGYHTFLRNGFSLGTEILIKNFNGERDKNKSDALGFGIGYLLKWHFIRLKTASVYFNQGIGILFTKEKFPANGTYVNAVIQFGFGVNMQLSEKMVLDYGVRHYHSSNGQGFVENNPAYDSIILYTGIGYYF